MPEVANPPQKVTAALASETFTARDYLIRAKAEGPRNLGVDPKTGIVSHISPIEADAAIVSRMKAACAK